MQSFPHDPHCAVNTTLYYYRSTKDVSRYERCDLGNSCSESLFFFMQALVPMEHLQASYCTTAKHDSRSLFSSRGLFELKLYALNKTDRRFCSIVCLDLFHKRTKSQCYTTNISDMNQLPRRSFRKF